MPTQAERLEAAITLLEALVANTTGTGDMVLKNSPTLVTPTLGVASATSLSTSGSLTVGTTLTVATHTLALGGNVSFGATGRSLANSASVDAAFAALGLNSSTFATFAGTITAGTAIFTYGSATDSSCVVHDGTITNANADSIVVVQGAGKLKKLNTTGAGRIIAATVNASPAAGDVVYFTSGSAAGTFPTNSYFRDSGSAMTATGFALASAADDRAARAALRVNRMSSIHAGDASWTTPVAISGSVSTNTYFGGTRTGQITTATAGFGRFYYNSANSCNPYTGSRTSVNYSLSFRVSFRALIYVNANTSSKVTILIATATGTVAHDLAAIGFGIQAYGNGTSCRIRIQSHNGTSATNGTDVAWTTADDTFYDFDFIWTPGVGATLYKDDASLCTIATGLPSGNGVLGATCFMGLFENGSGASDVTTLRLMHVTIRR